jgi:hypothetical protein
MDDQNDMANVLSDVIANELTSIQKYIGKVIDRYHKRAVMLMFARNQK